MTIIKPPLHDHVWLNKSQKYGTLTYMTKDSINETMVLRKEIWDEIEEKDWFAVSTKKDFENVLKYGFALVCIVDRKVIASLQCLLMNTDYSRDLFETEEEQMKCADYSDVFVHPAYRGNGLQNILETSYEKSTIN